MPANAGCWPRENVEIVRSLTDGGGLEAEVEAALELLALAPVLDVGQALERLHPAQRLAVDTARLRPPCRWPLPLP